MGSREFTVWLLTAGAGLIIAALLGVERFGQSDFVKTGFPLIARGFGGYDVHEYWGVLVSTTALPLAIQTLYTASWKSFSAFKTIWAHFIIATLCSVLAWKMYTSWKAKNLLDCGVVLCAFWGDTSRRHDTANGYFQVISVPMFVLCLVFATAHVSFAIVKLLRKRAVKKDSELEEPLLLLQQRKTAPQTLRRFALISSCLAVLTVLLVCFFASILLPNSWLNWTARKIRINAIEIVDKHSAFRDFKFGLVTRPEVPGAVFRTLQVKLGHRVWGKIFPDVYLFYGWLVACITLLACTKRGMWRLRAVGVLVISVVMLVCYIHAWWYHNWHGWYGGIGQFVFKEPGFNEKLARTCGLVSLLLLGILLLPVSRHSSLLHLTQVSHEQVLVWHRAVANAFLVVTIVHIAAWWAVFAEQQVFPHDAVSGMLPGTVPSYFPLNYHAKPGKCSKWSCLDPQYNKPSADNFTIPLMNFVVAYIAFPAFGVLTLHAIRRKYYEWFYYAHVFAGGVLICAVIWHAACVLVFLLPALLFMAFDLGKRFVQNSNARHIEEFVKYGDGVVGLNIERQGMNITAGQYVMIQVPSISELAFHPFSVSRVDTETFSLHVHATGEDTDSFSRRLVRLGDQGTGGVAVHVQGPFGLPPDFTTREALVFVAGGIGVTPILCIVRDLVNTDKVCCPITILWTSRRNDLFAHFVEWIDMCSKHEMIEIKLFCTAPAAVGEELGLPQIQCKRPNLDEEIPPLLNNSNSLVYACGPQALIHSAQQAAASGEFFKEVFEF